MGVIFAYLGVKSHQFNKKYENIVVIYKQTVYIIRPEQLFLCRIKFDKFGSLNLAQFGY